MQSIKQQIDAIVLDTNKFQALYELEDWDELTLALDERQNHLESFFKQTIPEKDKSAVLEAILKIQASDSIYKSKLGEIRNSVKKELFSFKKHNNAAKSYANISKQIF